MQTSYSRHYVDLWQRHWWWRSRHQYVMRRIREQLDRRSTQDRPDVLDIGCCGGVMFDDLREFAEPYGIEPDPQLAPAVPQWSSRIEQVPFSGDYRSDRTYDLVLMLDVLEHIKDESGAVRALYELLTPGGSALLTVPALPALWSVHDDANLHFRRYTRKTLVAALTAAGFELQRVEYLFGWSLPLVAARRFIARSIPEDYRVSVPPQPINRLFEGLTRVEQRISETLRIPLPLGSSLLAIARRPDGACVADHPTSSMAGVV